MATTNRIHHLLLHVVAVAGGVWTSCCMLLGVTPPQLSPLLFVGFLPSVHSFQILPTTCTTCTTTTATSRRTTSSSLTRFSAAAATTTDNNDNETEPYYYLAVITEPDACATEERLEETLSVLQRIVGHVDLISVRVDNNNNSHDDDDDHDDDDEYSERVVRLIQRLVKMSAAAATTTLLQRTTTTRTRVVASSDWIEEAFRGGAHGIHVKESHRSKIPAIRRQQQQLTQDNNNNNSDPHTLPFPFWIGTSAHSIESALEAWKLHQPDYFFVGTCYPTQTHPEKNAADLEGPRLPGQIQTALVEQQEYYYKQQQPPENDDASTTTTTNRTTTTSISATFSGGGPPPPAPPIIVLAIGGITALNCHEPIAWGAKGVATIRAVLQAKDPVQVIQEMRQSVMNQSKY